MNKKIEEIIKQTIDIHYHVGPEIIPRKFDVEQLIEKEEGKIGGFVLKNHFYPTRTMAINPKNSKMKLFGGIVLNNFVGGLNPEAVYASALLDPSPIMVWFPTINAENFLKKSEYEIAPEWIRSNSFSARKTKNINAVRIAEDRALTQKTLDVLKMIKQCNAILATGHISWEESKMLTKKARRMGIQVVTTHPIYQRINMPVKIQKELAEKGCFIEQSYSMYSIDKIPIKKIAQQITIVGSKSVILSSDMGQSFSPPASVALKRFCKLLMKEGVELDELYTMLVTNPKKLLGIV